jgi:protein-L-isoaspartate(D-aspartate) O-methyltransferase
MDSIAKAFQEVRRADFLPQEVQELASLDTALPIGQGQTNSQPTVVAFMLEKLGAKAGEKVLDIGAGSGWTSALLSHIVGPKGKVVGIELIPELAERAKKNLAQMKNVLFLCDDGSKGYSPAASYDHILVSAALHKKELPKAWKEQLKDKGNIVVPIENSIWVFTKNGDEFYEKEYKGFVFVPFITKAQ